MFPVILFIVLMLELLIVSYLDLKYKKIANIWSLFNLVIYGVCLLIFPTLFSFSFQTFFYPLVFLGVGLLLFALKIMGAGDSKFLFTFFLLVPEPYHEQFFLKLIYSTIVIGLYLLFYNTFKNFDKIKNALIRMDIRAFKNVYGTKFSYAPIIALSWIIFAWEIRKILRF